MLKPGRPIRPIIQEFEVKSLLEDIYGFRCVFLKNLEGYDDRNYHVKVVLSDNNYVGDVNEDGYVLKILNSLDSEDVGFIEAQNQILLELREKQIICPEPVPTKTGKSYHLQKLQSGLHIVRLMKYITGIILCKAPSIGDSIFYEIGEFAAKLNLELSDNKNEAYITHKSLWMLNSLPELSQFLYAIKDQNKYETISKVMREFEEKVLKNKEDFEQGIIHGDLNEQNILIEQKNDENYKVKGVLDFGDSQYSCYLFELAIAVTYMLILGKSLEIGGIVIAGYNSIRKVPLKELKLLKLCVEARLCTSLVLGAYSSLQDPENDYILTTAKPGWQMLSKLDSMSNEEVLRIWLKSASKYSNNLDVVFNE